MSVKMWRKRSLAVYPARDKGGKLFWVICNDSQEREALFILSDKEVEDIATVREKYRRSSVRSLVRFVRGCVRMAERVKEGRGIR